MKELKIEISPNIESNRKFFFNLRVKIQSLFVNFMNKQSLFVNFNCSQSAHILVKIGSKCEKQIQEG